MIHNHIYINRSLPSGSGVGDGAVLSAVLQPLQVDVLRRIVRSVEGVDTAAVVVAEEALRPHHLKEGARGGDAAVPGHQELAHLPRGEELLQRLQQGGVCAVPV